MKSKFISVIFWGMLPVLAFAQDINFDDLRRAGTPLVKSYTINGAGAEGRSAVMKFGDIDTQRVEEHNARRRSYAITDGEAASKSSSGTSDGNKPGRGIVKSNSPSRGVEKITDNGKLSGVPSHLVHCHSGTRHAVYYKNGTWYHGLYMELGRKFDSWSVGQLAEHLCK